MPEKPSIYAAEHEDFRASVRAFMEKEVAPHHEQWEADGQVDREIWKKAGDAGLLCFDVPEEYGGPGVPDFRYNAVVTEEIVRIGASGLGGRSGGEANLEEFTERRWVSLQRAPVEYPY
jgi:alkylation response protein AidB-like acyl-CoA dehydrogenase